MEYTKTEAKQAARERFTGLWAATTAPFGPSGELDEAALRADLDRLTGGLHVDGIFCGGVMSEFWSLTGSEKRRLVEVVVDATRGKCPVIAHTGHTSAEQAIELTTHAQKAGADFAVLINPYYPAASDEGLYRWFKQVCGAVDIGIWLFDTAYSGVSLSLDLVERLAAIENVCGIKVGRDHAHYLRVLDRVGGQIMVCEPHEGTWLENMREHGQRCFMSSAAPYLYQTPEWQPMREYTGLAAARRLRRGRPGRRHARPGARGGGQVAARQAADGRRAGLDQGVGRPGRHVRRAGPAAGAAAHRGRGGRPRRRPGRGRAAAGQRRLSPGAAERPPAGPPLSPSPRPGRGPGRTA